LTLWTNTSMFVDKGITLHRKARWQGNNEWSFRL